MMTSPKTDHVTNINGFISQYNNQTGLDENGWLYLAVKDVTIASNVTEIYGFISPSISHVATKPDKNGRIPCTGVGQQVLMISPTLGHVTDVYSFILTFITINSQQA